MSDLLMSNSNEPRVQRTGTAHEIAPTPLPAVPPLRVLVSDDEPGIHYLYTQFLPAYGFDVISVPHGDGLQTLHLAQRMKPHLLITDQHKPGLNGDRLREALRSDPHTATLMMLHISAVDHAPFADPFTDVLAKPFALTTLLWRIALLLPLDQERRTQMTHAALKQTALDHYHPITGLPMLHHFDLQVQRFTAASNWAALDVNLHATSHHLPLLGRIGIEFVLARIADLLRDYTDTLLVGHPGFDQRLILLGSTAQIHAVRAHIQSSLANLLRRVSPYLGDQNHPLIQLRSLNEQRRQAIGAVRLRRMFDTLT